MRTPFHRLLIPSCVLFIALSATPRTAHAELGLGVFVGRPTGFDLKVDLTDRVALDFLFGVLHPARYGWDDFYTHVTVLFQLANIHADKVFIPFRLGIGGAIYDDDYYYDRREDRNFDLNLGVRVPFEVGVRFRKVPIEIYGEIAFRLELIDDVGPWFDGGVGVRFYL